LHIQQYITRSYLSTVLPRENGESYSDVTADLSSFGMLSRVDW